jgi:hypothetical protein
VYGTNTVPSTAVAQSLSSGQIEHSSSQSLVGVSVSAAVILFSCSKSGLKLNNAY